jgi:hypothetical protein
MKPLCAVRVLSLASRGNLRVCDASKEPSDSSSADRKACGSLKNFVQEKRMIFSSFRSADLKHFSFHRSHDLFDSRFSFLRRIREGDLPDPAASPITE